MLGYDKTVRFAARVLLVMTVLGTHDAKAQDFRSPDILVLGDSQISFGSGPPFVDFLSDLMKQCAPNAEQKRQLKALGKARVGVIGVRSTSLHSWTVRSGPAKGAICDIDPKWKVNAGAYGIVNKTNNEFVQIGQGRNYQFCASGQSPFEELFQPDYYAPKLLLLAFFGECNETLGPKSRSDTARCAGTQRATAQRVAMCIHDDCAGIHQEGLDGARKSAGQN